MAAAALLTSRPVQNAHTGIDLSVPEYQEIRGKMMSGHVEYNIVVVTQLAAFKSAKHKPEDTIQFMVSKKYSEMEEFYHKLLAHYPQAPLPPLPRKVLFVGETDIRERRAVFHRIVRCIAQDANLATSPELLEFLGTRSTSVIDIKGKNLPEEDEEEEVVDFFREERVTDVIPKLKSLNEYGLVKETIKVEEEEEENDGIDPLGAIKSKKTKKPTPSPVKGEKPKLTIFEDEEDADEGLFGSVKDSSFASNKRILSTKENLKFFEDPDLGGGPVMLGDSLLLPAAGARKDSALHFSRDEEEDAEELLLRVEEDLEKMWHLRATPKAKPPPKPAVPKKKPGVDATRKRAAVQAETMAGGDILKYIQDNESIGSTEEPSLF